MPQRHRRTPRRQPSASRRHSSDRQRPAEWPDRCLAQPTGRVPAGRRSERARVRRWPRRVTPPNSSVTDEPTATAAVLISVLVDDIESPKPGCSGWMWSAAVRAGPTAASASVPERRSAPPGRQELAQPLAAAGAVAGPTSVTGWPAASRPALAPRDPRGTARWARCPSPPAAGHGGTLTGVDGGAGRVQRGGSAGHGGRGLRQRDRCTRGGRRCHRSRRRRLSSAEHGSETLDQLRCCGRVGRAAG